MPRARTLTLLLLLALAGPLHAAPPTGDAWLDARLPDMDAYAGTYPDAFADELARFHHAPPGLVEDLLARPGWRPADAWVACALGRAIGRPCRVVAAAFDPAKGWAEAGKALDVPPDAPAWARLRQAFRDSYLRWGRPLPPEAPRATK